MDRPLTPTERRLSALGKAAGMVGLWCTDETRRSVESLSVDAYDALGYFERSLEGMRRIVARKERATSAPPEPRAPAGRAAPPRYRVGAYVRVRDDDPEHFHRTPGYVKGVVGRVTKVAGAFPDPESLGHGGPGLPLRTLYTVGFAMADLWPEADAGGGTVTADIYEHWLEPTEDGWRS